MSYSWLPPLLNRIADAAGHETALTIARVYGGSRITIPAVPKEDHWLVLLVGAEAAQKICNEFKVGIDGKTGAVLDLPVGPESPMNKLKAHTQRRIDRLLSDGVPVDHIARTVRVHRTTVFRRKALLGDTIKPKNNSQQNLFD